VEEDGRVLACKRATGPDDAERLIHEAAVLRQAQHPGVVELVSCEDVDGVMTLYTAFVGAHTLETAPSPTLEQAGVTVAKLASTVADLHQLGLIHGRIDPSHVLLGPAGRPVLCGFSGGGAAGERALEGHGAIAEFRDPAAQVDLSLSSTSDVYGLGTLLRVLVIGEGADAEPIPERRLAFGRGRPWNGYLRRALLTLADQCTDDEPLRRPSARRLAADIEALLPHIDEPTEPARESRGRGLTLAAAAIGFVLVFWAVTAFRGNDTTAAPPPTTSTSVATTPSTSPPTSVSHQTRDVSLVGERMVSVDGHQFSVGDPGDRVVLGDWDCDGVATAALARPSSGDVYVFDAWPDPGVDAQAEPVTTVSGAVDLRTEDRGDCTALFAIRADGSETEVL
jgi:hypothetical protein